MKKRILVVAAHPDDEILGCGGTIARLIKKGNRVSTLILGEGMVSREGKKKRDVKKLKEDAHKANKIIGVKDINIYDFPDNRFDTVSVLDIVKVIEKIKRSLRPDIIYTHHWNDLNIDHRICYKAVLTASRPVKNETVKEIYSFDIPSSTEWNYPNIFCPNIFVDVSETLDKKIKALKAYKTELRKFPHPRSEGAVRNIAKRWGSVAGLKCAEAFEAVRIIK